MSEAKRSFVVVSSAAGKALRVLEAAGVLCPRDERMKNRTLVFSDYLEVLRRGTELGG